MGLQTLRINTDGTCRFGCLGCVGRYQAEADRISPRPAGANAAAEASYLCPPAFMQILTAVFYCQLKAARRAAELCEETHSA